MVATETNLQCQHLELQHRIQRRTTAVRAAGPANALLSVDSICDKKRQAAGDLLGFIIYLEVKPQRRQANSDAFERGVPVRVLMKLECDCAEAFFGKLGTSAKQKG